MIHVQNLVGGYSHFPIIKGLDLEIIKGEFFALLGPNGSGKTTLFKLITGQLPTISGTVSICGKEISSLSKLEKAKKWRCSHRKFKCLSIIPLKKSLVLDGILIKRGSLSNFRSKTEKSSRRCWRSPK